MTVLEIDFTKPRTIKSSYNLANYEGVKIITDGSDVGPLEPVDFLKDITSVSASGNVLTVKAMGKSIKFNNFSSDMTIEAYGIKNDQTYYNSTLPYFYADKNAGVTITDGKINIDVLTRGTTVAGTNFDENIDFHTYTPTGRNLTKKVGLTINAGGGDDIITGTTYNDTITGGSGENTIVYNPKQKDANGFGTDTVKLSKGEELNLDLSEYGININLNEPILLPTKSTIRQLVSIVGNDLIIQPGNGEADGVVKLTNYAKSNVTGDGGVKIIFQKGETPVVLDIETFKELFSKTAAKDAVRGTITGTRFSDEITGDNTVKTINAGAGDDTITGGAGNQKITGGAGADTFKFAYTAQTGGAGVDTITDATAEDSIDISGTTAATLKYKKNGNNLEIFYKANTDGSLDENNKIIIQNYFKQKTNKIDDLTVNNTELSLSEQKILIQGNNANVVGTDNADDISVTAKKAISVTGGKGDDEIVVNNTKATTYVFNVGDGVDTITGAKKGDVIQINASWDSISVDKAANNADLVISYGTNDKVTLVDFFNSGNDVDETMNLDTIKAKNGRSYKAYSILKDVIFDKAITSYYEKTTIYRENIAISNSTVATISGLTTNDNLDVDFGGAEESFTYSRIFSGSGNADNNLTINNITVEDFFTNGKDFTVNGKSTLDATIEVTLTGSSTPYKATKYTEVFSGAGYVSGMSTKDKIVTSSSEYVDYSRLNNRGLNVDGIVVTDFNFDGKHDINVNDGTTQGITINVQLKDNFVYKPTVYDEVFTGKGSVSKLSANDNIAFSGTLSRKGNSNTLTISDGENEINVTDFNFAKENKTVKVSGDLVSFNDTIYVDLNGVTYTATKYKEVFSGSGTVKGIDVENDEVFLDGAVSYNRVAGSNDLQIVSANSQTGNSDSIKVVDFFKNGKDIIVNKEKTEGMVLNVELAGKSYAATDYQEVITGSGTVSGLNEKDTIVRIGDLSYERVAGSNDLKVIGTYEQEGSSPKTETTVLKDYFKDAQDVKVSCDDGDTSILRPETIISVNLNGKTFDTDDGFKYVFTGSGTVKNLGENVLAFAEGTDTEYTYTTAGLTVKGSMVDGRKTIVNTIVVSEFDIEEDSLSVYVGESVDGFEDKTLKVTGISEFAGTDRFGNVEVIGTAGADKLAGSVGDDSFTGGRGADEFIFTTGSGVDVIKDGTNEDLIRINSVIETDDIGVAINEETGKVEITYNSGSDYVDKIILDKFDKTKPATCLDKILVKNSEGGYNSISILSRLGIDNPNTDTLVLENGSEVSGVEKSGDDLVINYFANNDSKSETIKGYFSTGSKIQYVQQGEAGSVLSLKDDFGVVVGTNGADTITGREGNDIIVTKGGNDIINVVGSYDDYDVINAGAGANTIKFTTGGYTVIENGKGTDTLVFEEGVKVEAYESSEDESSESSEMYIHYYKPVQNYGYPTEDGEYSYDNDYDYGESYEYSGSVCLKDYKNTSVKTIKVGSVSGTLTEFTSRYYEGTEGNDTVTSRMADETFNLKTGNDKVIFGKNFGHDVIESILYDKETGKKYTDTLQFNNYSLQDGNLHFSNFDPDVDTCYGKSLRVFAGNSEEEEEYNVIKYKDFFVGTPKVVNIKDTKATFNVTKYDGITEGYTEVDYTTSSEVNKNHVTFVMSKNEKSLIDVKSGKGYNNYQVSHSTAEDEMYQGPNSYGVNYYYGGGHDNINADYGTIDTYNVTNFNKNTTMSITDLNSYGDTLNIGADIEKVRLLFNVGLDEKDQAYISEDHYFVHTDNMTVSGLKNQFTDDWVKKRGIGVTSPVYTDGESITDDSFAIETVNIGSGDNVKTVDIESWRSEITANVQGWLLSDYNTGNYDSVYAAFTNSERLSSEALAALVNCYDVDYSTSNNG